MVKDGTIHFQDYYNRSPNDPLQFSLNHIHFSVRKSLLDSPFQFNLKGEIPTWCSRFERVIELVQPESEHEQVKRENFRFYKERGYALDFHDLTNSFS